MITFSPSPSWKVLLTSLFCKKPDDAQLAAPWCQKGDQAVWFSRTAWSLHVIVRWWKMNFSKKPVIWVPGYFCNQSLWPLRQTNAKIIFYPIQEKMLPHWAACETLAKQSKPDIFIVTHFYGFITPTTEIDAFCKRHNTLLIEDAAHIITPTADVGKRGHFILYSPYKLFSLPHGAVCIIKPLLYDFLKNQNINEKVTLQQVLAQIETTPPPIAIWFVKKILQKIIRDKLDFLRKKKPFEEDGTSDPMPYTLQMHPVSKKMLSLMTHEIPHHIAHRRKCAVLWERLFKENNIQVARLTFNREETPYIGVFKAVNEDAPAIYNTFKRWPLSSWPDLPPEVKANPILHQTTIHFRNNMLVVPVHQTLQFIELIKRFTKNKLYLNHFENIS